MVADDELRGYANINFPPAYSASFKNHPVADQAIMLITPKGHRYRIPRHERSPKPISTVTVLLTLRFDLKCQDRLIRPVDQNEICGCSTSGQANQTKHTDGDLKYASHLHNFPPVIILLAILASLVGPYASSTLIHLHCPPPLSFGFIATISSDG
jgi:hypothetical protein